MNYENTNVIKHFATVTRQRREKQNRHRSAVVWFTGLSGSGKSTLAHAVEEELHQYCCRTFVLDGDNVRHGLCNDLGFSIVDRRENIRRIAEVAKLMTEAGMIVMTAFISPLRTDREWARSLLSATDFIEIYCTAQLAVCESRDVKGLYRKARTGELKEFTGISSPYEPPLEPDIAVNTGEQSLNVCVAQVLGVLAERGLVRGRSVNCSE